MTNLKAMEIWTATTMCNVGILLSIVSFFLHIGRTYFERIQRGFKVPLVAAAWWMMYVLWRDGTLFAATLLGFLNLNLDLMSDIKVGLPFVPLGTVALAAALLVKVFWNAEDVNPAWRLATRLAGLGALLNLVGYVFVMEGAGEEYASYKSAFWQVMDSWKSNQNPQLATVTFFVVFPLLMVIAIVAAIKAVRLYAEVGKTGKTRSA